MQGRRLHADGWFPAGNGNNEFTNLPRKFNVAYVGSKELFEHPDINDIAYYPAKNAAGEMGCDPELSTLDRVKPSTLHPRWGTTLIPEPWMGCNPTPFTLNAFWQGEVQPYTFNLKT